MNAILAPDCASDLLEEALSGALAPVCDFCDPAARTRPAHYGHTHLGTWAFMCEEHWELWSTRGPEARAA